MHPTTQAHMKSHLHQATNHILYWIVTAKKTVPKKTQTRRNTGSLCQAHVRAKGDWGYVTMSGDVVHWMIRCFNWLCVL